ncbi:MAG: serine acetyltransferase [Prevotellaceae bacterium]|nr:serine acetyltransferase [Prevotellaceae bacterium]
MVEQIESIAQRFAEVQSLNSKVIQPCYGIDILSHQAVSDVVSTIRELLFPGHFGGGNARRQAGSAEEGSSAKFTRLHGMLTQLIKSVACAGCAELPYPPPRSGQSSEQLSLAFLAQLPDIAQLLSLDVQAICKNDPAACSYSEVIFTYPGIRAMTSYRIAHQLLLLGIPMLPRMITEMAHSDTGIDIHPGATIGRGFAIDHGTGIVIGGTCIIGDNVTIYQGVTLGAKKIIADKKGALVKGTPRHPIIEDDVTIYAGATILGRITVGRGSIIGGNVWLMDNIPANSKITRKDTL